MERISLRSPSPPERPRKTAQSVMSRDSSRARKIRKNERKGKRNSRKESKGRKGWQSNAILKGSTPSEKSDNGPAKATASQSPGTLDDTKGLAVDRTGKNRKRSSSAEEAEATATVWSTNMTETWWR